MKTKITIFNKEGITLDIYLSPEQVVSLNELNYKLRIRTLNFVSKNPNYYPEIEINQNGEIKKLHLGRYLYPHNKRPWDSSIWKSLKWDFTKENLNLSDLNSFFCRACNIWLNHKEELRTSICVRCHYLKELIRYAKNRAKKDNMEFSITYDDFKDCTQCQIIKIPLKFIKNQNLVGLVLTGLIT